MEHGKSIWQDYHSFDMYPPYPDGSMFSFVAETARRIPDYTALECNGKKVSYRTLLSQIEKFAGILLSFGVKKGDFVSVVSVNVPEALIAVYAANRIGAVANVLHPLLPADELQYAVENTNSKVLVTLDLIYPKFAKMDWHTGCRPVTVLVRISDSLPWYAKPVYGLKNAKKTEHYKNCIYWHDLMKKPCLCPTERDEGTFDDTAVILYSGGTTGKPKGIVLTNGNFNCLAVQSHDVYGEDNIAGTHSLALMPVFHGFGLGVCMHGMLCNGLHIFVVPVYDMKSCAKLIFKRKISFLFGVPTLYEALSKSEEIEKKDLSFIRFLVCAGDRLSPALADRLNRQLKNGGSSAFIREAYGLTEVTSGCCINPFFAPKEGSIGIPYADMCMKIIAGDGTEIEDGTVGEICIAGPTVMKGYYKSPEATEKVLRRHADGKIWLHTGDMGYRDKDGYFFFCDRKSRMIVSSGYNVYPEVIESVLNSSPFVKQSCVVGVPDRVLGERICACVVPSDSSDSNDSLRRELERLCAEKLSGFSRIHEYRFLQELPLSPLGKIDFKKLTKER